MEQSAQEFDAGDDLQGSEKLWGAATQAGKAIARQRGWRHGKSFHRAAAVDSLSEELNEPQLKLGYSLAEKFHANFYNDFMEDYVITRDRPLLHNFVQRMVAIAEGIES